MLSQERHDSVFVGYVLRSSKAFPREKFVPELGNLVKEGSL